MEQKKILRTYIDGKIDAAIEFCREMRFPLPPQAYWSLQEWYDNRKGADEQRARGIGWDITDFGLGDFEKVGLMLYTLSNGILVRSEKISSADDDSRLTPLDQPYAHKLLISGKKQVTPMHHHILKREDIINWGEGSNLVIEIYNVGKDDKLDVTSPVRVYHNNTWREYKAGHWIVLTPGERVRLDQHHYHKFWGEGGTALITEVSMVNDDNTDNVFLDNILSPGSIGRFPDVEEDDCPRHLLCNELPGTEKFTYLADRRLNKNVEVVTKVK